MAFLSARASAAEVGSEVHAVVLTAIAGGAGANGTATHLSVPVVSGVFAGGAITGLSSSRIVDTSSTWTDAQFNPGSERYYVLLTSGAAIGWSSEITGTNAAARALGLAKSLPSTVLVGDRYRVLRHVSLEAAFSDVNASAVTAAGHPTDADNVLLFDASTQRTSTLFKSSVAGFNGWFDSTYGSVTPTSLPLGTGWMVRRKSAIPTSLLWVGVVRADSFLCTVRPGLNLLGLGLAADSAPLANLGLYTANIATGIRAGATLGSSDRLIAVKSDGTTSQYFYSNAAGQVGWRDENGASAESVTFTAGTAFFLDRDAASPTFDWRISP